MLRSYEEDKIYVNGTNNVTNEVFSSHFSILERSDSESGQFKAAASCITFMPNERVPVGKKYHVRNKKILFAAELCQAPQV